MVAVMTEIEIETIQFGRLNVPIELVKKVTSLHPNDPTMGSVLTLKTEEGFTYLRTTETREQLMQTLS